MSRRSPRRTLEAIITQASAPIVALARSDLASELGRDQGMTDQVVMSRTPGSFGTMLVARGSSRPEWLTH